MVLQLSDFNSDLSEDELRQFTSDYYIPLALHPVVPAANASIANFPQGKVGVYTRFFEFANQRVPISLFLCDILNHYRLHISQLHCIGAAKVTNFEVNCRLLAIEPTVHLFRAFYHTSWLNGWVTFAKRAGSLQCYAKKLDALRVWREKIFWIDSAFFPWVFEFYTQESLPRDERPDPGLYNVADADTINTNRIPIEPYPEEFLVHMGISRNYFGSPEEVPTFLDENSRGGCLSLPSSSLSSCKHSSLCSLSNTFSICLLFCCAEMDLFDVVRLAKPTKVIVGVRSLRDGEQPLLQATAGRTMVIAQEETEETEEIGEVPTGVTMATPLRSFPAPGSQIPAELFHIDSSGSAMDESEEEGQGLKRKRSSSDDGAGTSSKRPAISVRQSSEESASQKDASGTPPFK